MKRSASVLADISMWDVIKIGIELLEKKMGWVGNLQFWNHATNRRKTIKVKRQTCQNS